MITIMVCRALVFENHINTFLNHSVARPIGWQATYIKVSLTFVEIYQLDDCHVMKLAENC